MAAKRVFMICVIVFLVSIFEIGNAGRGKGRGGRKEKQERKEKGKLPVVTLKSLEEEIKELRGQLEAIPKKSVNVYMHGPDFSTTENSTNDEDDDDTHIHVHMEAARTDTCSNEEIHGHCEVAPNENLADGYDVTGMIHFIQKGDDAVEVHIEVSGFNMSREPMVHAHGFHIHQFGDLSDSCDSLGGHFNPVGVMHGARGAKHSHAGDLGNIDCDAMGEVSTKITVEKISLRGKDSIIGRSIVIHEGTDDLGLGGNPGSHAAGNAGGRLACCLIAVGNPEKYKHLHDKEYEQEEGSGHHHDGK